MADNSPTDATSVLENTFKALNNNIDIKDNTLDDCKSNFKKSSKFKRLERSPYSRPHRIVRGSDTRSFLRELEDSGQIDETNFTVIREALKKYSPETLSVIRTNRDEPVEEDPVASYLKKVMPQQLTENKSKRKRKCRYTKLRKKTATTTTRTENNTEQKQNVLDKPHNTCYLRMHIQVTHRLYMHYVQQAVQVHEDNVKKRQFEKFNQAFTIMKQTLNENLGFSVEFSQLTLLDSFWRDYHNGLLVNVLNTLLVKKLSNSTIGETDIQLYVDEKQYREGRLRLLQNLTG